MGFEAELKEIYDDFEKTLRARASEDKEIETHIANAKQFCKSFKEMANALFKKEDLETRKIADLTPFYDDENEVEFKSNWRDKIYYIKERVDHFTGKQFVPPEDNDAVVSDQEHFTYNPTLAGGIFTDKFNDYIKCVNACDSYVKKPTKVKWHASNYIPIPQKENTVQKSEMCRGIFDASVIEAKTLCGLFFRLMPTSCSTEGSATEASNSTVDRKVLLVERDAGGLLTYRDDAVRWMQINDVPVFDAAGKIAKETSIFIEEKEIKPTKKGRNRQRMILESEFGFMKKSALCVPHLRLGRMEYYLHYPADYELEVEIRTMKGQRASDDLGKQVSVVKYNKNDKDGKPTVLSKVEETKDDAGPKTQPVSSLPSGESSALPTTTKDRHVDSASSSSSKSKSIPLASPSSSPLVAEGFFSNAPTSTRAAVDAVDKDKVIHPKTTIQKTT